jgi:hypothetical protein
LELVLLYKDIKQLTKILGDLRDVSDEVDEDEDNDKVCCFFSDCMEFLFIITFL